MESNLAINRFSPIGSGHYLGVTPLAGCQMASGVVDVTAVPNAPTGRSR